MVFPRLVFLKYAVVLGGSWWDDTQHRWRARRYATVFDGPAGYRAAVIAATEHGGTVVHVG